MKEKYNIILNYDLDGDYCFEGSDEDIIEIANDFKVAKQRLINRLYNISNTLSGRNRKVKDKIKEFCDKVIKILKKYKQYNGKIYLEFFEGNYYMEVGIEKVMVSYQEQITQYKKEWV